MHATRHRRSIRLRGYDCTKPGAYFLTICTADRAPLFGEVVDGIVHHTSLGGVASAFWTDIGIHFSFVTVDAFIVMPDHVHGILVFNGDGRGVRSNAPTVARHGAIPPNGVTIFSAISPRRGSLAVVVQSDKGAVTSHARRDGCEGPVWQRGNHEHIIRDEQARARIRRYIVSKPARWREARVRSPRGTGG